MKPHMGLHSNSLPTNIRQGWKEIAAANTLAYCVTVTITAVESFIVKAPETFYARKLCPFQNKLYRLPITCMSHAAFSKWTSLFRYGCKLRAKNV